MSGEVLVTRVIPEEGMKILQNNNFNCRVHDQDRPIMRSEFEEAIRGTDAVLSMLNDRIDADLLDLAPALKIVANLAAGTDNIDLKACTKRGIAVTNTPGVLTEATADLAMALLLAAARHLVQADQYLREGKFNGWDPLLFTGTALNGKTLGIIGMGRIGRAVAKRARGFGLKIVYHNRKSLPEEITSPLGAEYLSLDDLIKSSDFISLHLPYSREVHHLIDSRRLSMMKVGTYLINTARGAHIDEKSLVESLRAGNIAGAALDVFEHEPQTAPGLTDLDNVTLLPHIGSATLEARTEMSRMSAESIAAVLNGKKPDNIINPEVLNWK
ncbi:MAG: 2-hydroxyacid dehydrogenase [Bacillota bacterium]